MPILLTFYQLEDWEHHSTPIMWSIHTMRSTPTLLSPREQLEEHHCVCINIAFAGLGAGWVFQHLGGWRGGVGQSKSAAGRQGAN